MRLMGKVDIKHAVVKKAKRDQSIPHVGPHPQHARRKVKVNLGVKKEPKEKNNEIYNITIKTDY